MLYRLLGPLKVFGDDGQPVALRSDRERVLLASLLLRANHVVAADMLVDALWGVVPPRTATNTLQVHVSNLRRRLVEASRASLEAAPSGYVLRTEPAEVDLEVFNGLLTSPPSDPAGLSARMGEALALWRGAALADVFSDRLAGEKARLDGLRLFALGQRIAADLALGRHLELVPELEALVLEHPLSEDLRGHLMIALYRSGRQADALAIYQSGRSMLRRELGIDPSPALQELELSILQQSPNLTPNETRSGRAAEGLLSTAERVPAAVIRRPRVGAALERPRLDRAGAAPGLLIVGPAGSGKTVLAAQLAAKSGRAGWLRLTPGRSSGSDLVALAAASLGVPGPPAPAGIVELAGHLAEMLDEPTLLVVDDYGAALGQECDPVLAEALAVLAEGSMIIICSRCRPPGLLGRVAAGILGYIDAEELAFTSEEMRQLFEANGSHAAEADRTFAELGGWAAGAAVAAATGFPVRRDALVSLVDASLGDSHLVEAMAVLPYLTTELVTALGLGDEAALAALGQRSMLVLEQGGEWRLSPAAAAVLGRRVDPTERARWRATAASVLGETDPATAVDLLVEDGAHVEAIELARLHLSQIAPERSVPWLYRIPDELRHQMPPVLAGGRATVDLDAATAAAEEAVHRAADDRSRREAMFGLGSAHLHAGRLADAAAALEVASGPGSPTALATKASAWLAVARWWAGDLTGALAAAAAGGDDPVANWVSAEVALVRGDLGPLPEHPCLGGAAVVAKIALAAGDIVAGRQSAAAAYQEALADGGFALAVAGPVEAWYLVAAGDLDGAMAVAEVVNRRIGRHDSFASLHVWLVRLAVATARGERRGIEEAAARVARIREQGFAAVDTQARSMLAPLAGVQATGLSVRLLGVLTLEVDGKPVDTGWRSAKALEVLAYLALRSPRGAHREEVIEAVWPEREPDKGRMLLRAALSEIRRRLEPARHAGEPSRFLSTSGERIVLVAEVDIAAARSLRDAGKPLDALALYRGELLEDFPYADWVLDDRRALSTMRLELAERTASDGAAPEPARVDALELLIDYDPWRAELYDRLAAIHAASGHEGAAEAVLRRKRDALTE